MRTLEKIISSARRFGITSLLVGTLAVSPFLSGCGGWGNNPITPPLQNTIEESKPLQGVCYSPFREGQDPNLGIFPIEDEIEEDLSIISGIASTQRPYGNDSTLYEIPRLSDEWGVGCYPAAWISDDKSANETEIKRLIEIANQDYYTTKGLIVGSEVLLRGDISEAKLEGYISQVNEATEIPVTTAETWNVWLEHPDLADAVDYIWIHVHPYWEGISVDDAAEHVIEKWNRVKQAYLGKEVIIGETGWPTAGYTVGNAVPSEENQKKFLTEFKQLAEENNAKYFFFEAFDESWKAQYEGEVGAHWGLYNADRTPKLAIEDIIINK